VHYGSRVAVAGGLGQFGNPGRGMFVLGSRYQRTGMGQHIEMTQCVYSELSVWK
jgi:hypothetical protein